jgi:hypothetical protein
VVAGALLLALVVAANLPLGRVAHDAGPHHVFYPRRPACHP